MIEIDYHTIQRPMFKYIGPSSWFENGYVVADTEPYVDEIQKAIFADLERDLRKKLPVSSDTPGEFITLQVPQATNFNSCKVKGCIAVGDYFNGKARVTQYREDIASDYVRVIDTEQGYRKFPPF